MDALVILTGSQHRGYCIVLFLDHTQDGNYGDIRLDGLVLSMPPLGPKPYMKEMDGTLQLFISKSASEKQRDALVKIFQVRQKEKEVTLSSDRSTSIYLSRSL
jgi:hypothetical protein